MKHGYLVMKMMREATVDILPFPISLKNKNEKLMGVCPIFSTKKKAEEEALKGKYPIYEIELIDEETP